MDRQILIYVSVCLFVCGCALYIVAGVVHLATFQSTVWPFP